MTQMTDRQTIDPLTGAASLQQLQHELPRELARCQRYGHPIAILLCDIDRLKLINDGFGRQAGDETLRSFHARAVRVLRSSDWIARQLEDAFVIVLPETDLAGAGVVAERIRNSMRNQPISTGRDVFPATVSIGYAGVISPRELPRFTADDLLQAAHEQLQLAIRNGRDRACGAVVKHSQDAGVHIGDTATLCRDGHDASTRTIVPAPEHLTLVEYDGTPAGVAATQIPATGPPATLRPSKSTSDSTRRRLWLSRGR